MRRIVRGAVLALGAGVAVSGCGSQQAAPVKEWSTASLTAAVLSPQDMPRGFLPAEAQEAFRGVAPRDADCRRLLAVADGHGLRDVPGVSTAFYQVAPGATISQKLVHTGAARGQQVLQYAKRLTGLCPVIEAEVGGTRMQLRREQLAPKGLSPKQSVAVRYRQKASANYEISYEMVFARVGDDLLLLANPGIVHRKAPSVTAAAARKATFKLVNAHKMGA